MKKVKVIITGGRDFNDYDLFKEVLNHLFEDFDVHIVSGACAGGTLTFVRPDGTMIYGADGLAEKYAAEYNCKFTAYPADWNKHGRSAGPIRNTEMSKSGADVCVGFWDGKSRGTFDMMTKANNAGITVIEKRYEPVV